MKYQAFGTYRPVHNSKDDNDLDLYRITWLRLVKQMAGHKIAHATLKGPSVIKEICIGITLGLIAGGMWKMHHWNEQRKVRAFYDMLEKGEISVVAEE
ncbi:hypothetical protein HHK36_012266 [Tetracentron sinense]|uniref:Cytochrome c oxidase subunit 5C n=1 Tax=Tetracentron sinense TaxID=13715 RepID=A0A834ZF25_TETSI|nr:hypothetical protein HHK36_012266 [Tetracentron sinense]